MLSWITNLFSSDETRDWPEVRPVPLTLDLSRQSLNGVRLGDPTDRLRLIGRPKVGKAGTLRYFDYPTLGFQACGDEVKGLVTFGVALGDVEPTIPPTQSLTFMLNNRSVQLKPGSRLEEIENALNVSFKKEKIEDEEEMNATLAVGDFDCVIECSTDGRLQWIELFRR